MATIISTTHTTGATVYAFPGSQANFANWASLRVLATETVGEFEASVDDDTYGPVWYFFEGSTAPTSFDDHIASVNLQWEIDLLELLSKTTNGVTTSAAVATDGTIAKIIIGDDYLLANGRGFEWTVDEVTGFVAGSCTCTFGGKYKDNTWLVTGTVVDNEDGTWTLRFNLEDTDTANLEPGQYRWSVGVQYNGTVITRVMSDCTTALVEKQT
ncbi:hypothetical protein VN12_19600 [Pirellula sp. SH-Sr6A]|uniref:hypothetical protein n=1 Tax=Pirellula sp. SH-Sr6A TaxID=1632865 RepID=UPI00078CF21C|nr:hypothetical protein [Pirellula sp. SH-Sr6A]AMV34340.1 hypothetical protein VN12_19600 [Pirellula sp. SH-Sr6A]